MIIFLILTILQNFKAFTGDSVIDGDAREVVDNRHSLVPAGFFVNISLT